MEGTASISRIIAKLAVALLICCAATAAMYALDHLHPALAYLPYLGIYFGCGWLVYRLVREDVPGTFLEWLEVFIYGFLVTFIAMAVAGSAF